MNENRIIQILTAIIAFGAGYWLHGYLHTCPAPETITRVEYRDRVQTEIAYVPKETIVYKDGSTGTEKTDVDVQLGKPDLNVKVNGKEMAIEKADDEQYIFEKNKMTLTQTSSADLNIIVPTVDNTKHYEIGLGVSKEGLVGLVGFPVRGDSVGGWVAGNRDNVIGGISVRF